MASLLERLFNLEDDYDYDFSMFDDDEFEDEFRMTKEQVNRLLNRLKKFRIIE